MVDLERLSRGRPRLVVDRPAERPAPDEADERADLRRTRPGPRDTRRGAGPWLSVPTYQRPVTALRDEPDGRSSRRPAGTSGRGATTHREVAASGTTCALSSWSRRTAPRAPAAPPARGWTAPPARPAAPGSVPPAAPLAPGHARRRRTSAAVALLVVGIVLGDAAGDARARAGLAALVRVAGRRRAGSTAPPPSCGARTRPCAPSSARPAACSSASWARAAAADVVGLDPATGAVVVAHRRPGERAPGTAAAGCAASPREPAPGPAAPAPRRVPTVVCVVDRAARPRAGGDDPTAVGAPPSRGPRGPAAHPRRADRRAPGRPDGRAQHRAVGARRGRRRRSRRPRRVRARRADGPVRGEQVRWSFVAPRPLPRSHLAWATRIAVEDGVVVVDEADGWALSADGEVLHAWTAAPREQLEGTAQVVGAGRSSPGREPRLGAAWPRSVVTDLRTGRLVRGGRAARCRPGPTTAPSTSACWSGPRQAASCVAHDASGAARVERAGQRAGPRARGRRTRATDRLDRPVRDRRADRRGAVVDAARPRSRADLAPHRRAARGGHRARPGRRRRAARLRAR